MRRGAGGSRVAFGSLVRKCLCMCENRKQIEMAANIRKSKNHVKNRSHSRTASPERNRESESECGVQVYLSNDDDDGRQKSQ